MNSAAGLGNGLFSANQRGSVWPCGEIMGRSRTVSYSFTAMARAVGSAGKRRFRSSMGVPLLLLFDAAPARGAPPRTFVGFFQHIVRVRRRLRSLTTGIP